MNTIYLLLLVTYVCSILITRFISLSLYKLDDCAVVWSWMWFIPICNIFYSLVWVAMIIGTVTKNKKHKSKFFIWFFGENIIKGEKE